MAQGSSPTTKEPTGGTSESAAMVIAVALNSNGTTNTTKNPSNDPGISTVPPITPTVAPTQMQPPSTATLGPQAPPPLAHVGQGLTCNFSVSFDIDSLTPTQMRLIIARAAQTHPTIISTSYSHVLKMLLEERQMSNLANRESSITRDVPLYKLIGAGAGGSSTTKNSAALPTPTVTGMSSTATVNRMVRPMYLPPNFRGGGGAVMGDRVDKGDEMEDANSSQSISPPALHSGKRSLATMESTDQKPELHPQDYAAHKSNGERIKRKQIRSKCFNRTPSVSWDERFEMLIQFKAKYGHLQLKRGSTQHPVLGQWCSNQRAFRNMLVAGKKPFKINQERIEKLTAIGFQWAGVEKEKGILEGGGGVDKMIQVKTTAPVEVDTSIAKTKDKENKEKDNQNEMNQEGEKAGDPPSSKKTSFSLSSLQV